jgi:hypothetical protein
MTLFDFVGDIQNMQLNIELFQETELRATVAQVLLMFVRFFFLVRECSEDKAEHLFW